MLKNTGNWLNLRRSDQAPLVSSHQVTVILKPQFDSLFGIIKWYFLPNLEYLSQSSFIILLHGCANIVCHRDWFLYWACCNLVFSKSQAGCGYEEGNAQREYRRNQAFTCLKINDLLCPKGGHLSILGYASGHSLVLVL
jgi:hypothetical protein